MYKNLAAALCAACVASLAGAFFSPVHSQTPAKAQEPLKVGFVYVAPIADTGWVHQHDEGRKAVDAAFGAKVRTRYVENVPEGADAERVIRDLAQQGYQLIFTPSFGYMEPTLKVARDFPAVKFESITGYKSAPNVATANARYYEGRYLAGIAAGRMTRTHVAGYVAGFPIPEVLQGINAFTLGMRSVDPKAQVKVVWLNAWFDPPRERDAAMSLFNQDVDVIAFHTASDAAMVAAQERGKMAVAYHSDMRKVAPDAQIAAVTHHWGDYYKARTQAVLDGSWKSGNVWGGVKEGMIRIGGFGPKVPQTVQAEVLQGINAFTLGMRSVDPKAQVKVVWLNAWFDPPRERDAAMSLFNQDVDVIAFHTASDAAMVAAQERGKMAVAYHSDMRKAGPDAQIAAVTHHWGDYYKARTQAVLDGSWKSGNLWGGVKEGMIRVGGFGPKVPQTVQVEVLARQKDIAAGKLQPFAGPLSDNEGKLVVPKGQAMTDEQILSMNFLVSGVQGKVAK